jgi:uncharacterized protein (TIGR02145 family)
MRALKFIPLIAFAMLLSTCSKDKASETPPLSLLEVTQVLTSTEDKFIGFGQPSGTTPQEALRLTADWLKTQPNINTATIVDDAFIDIRLNSGLSAVFFLDIMDEDSISITRGGGPGGTSVELNTPFKSKYIIENKKVLLCYPNLEEFYKEAEVKNIVARLQSSELGLEVTKKEYGEVNPDLISTFGNYGLVIINTHGFKDCFLSGSRIDFDARIDSTDVAVKNFVILKFGQKTYDDLTNGLLRLGFHVRTSSGSDWVKNYTKKDKGFTIWIGSEYIRSLPDMPKTIILGNFCYSGQTNPSKEYPDPIGAAFNAKKLISYYSYNDGKGEAYQVSNSFAKAMEDSVSKALLIDIDSTGNSHLSYKGAEFKDPKYPGYLKQNGAKDYSYEKCGEDFIDSRDGKKYKTVCIGNQVWMAENLNYEPAGGLCYDELAENCGIYGRMYTWNEVMNGSAASNSNPSGVRGICPTGWHVPSAAEWEQLFTFLGGYSVAGGELKSTSNLWGSPNTGATNSSGFNALPGGSMGGQGPGFPIYPAGKGEYTVFRTTSATSANNSYVRLTKDAPSAVIYPSTSFDWGWFACRCLKDKN